MRAPWILSPVLLAAVLLGEPPARTAAPQRAQEIEFQCQTLASGQRAAEATGCYQRLLRMDLDTFAHIAAVRLALARNQSWSGRWRQAVRNYEGYLRMRPNDREATIELIRLQRYRGSYEAAEKLCNRWLEGHADDAQVLALKAEALHWAGGRLRSARSAADQAMALAPEMPEAEVSKIYALRDAGEGRAARAQFQALRDQVRRAGGPEPGSAYGDAYRYLDTQLAESTRSEATAPLSVYNDSDGIHETFAGLEFTTPWYGDRTLGLRIHQYASSAPAGSPFTAGRDNATVREFSAGGTLWSGAGASVTAFGGASTRLGDGALRPIFDLRASASPMDRWTFDFQAGREFLALTPRAIDLDISDYRVRGGARYVFDSRTTLETGTGRRWFSDGNRSVMADATLTRTVRYSRVFLVRTGLLTRYEAFDRDTRLASGFFTPDQYWRHDAFLSAHGEAGRVLTWEVMGAGGTQRIMRAAAYKPSWEFHAVTGIRITGSLRLFANYQVRNYSLLAAQGCYQGFYVSLGVRP